MTGIYRIVNAVTGRTYIGSSVHMKARFKEHKWYLRHAKHHNPKLQQSWNKHGEHSFIFEPLLICPSSGLEIREQKFLDAYRDHNMLLYNLRASDTSRRGMWFRHTAETRAKMSASRNGHVVSAETRAKIGAANTGKTRSSEFRARLSNLWKGRAITPGIRAKMSAGRLGKGMGKRKPSV